MTLLSAISVLCFFVMLYVAIAVTQTIRTRRFAAAELSGTVPPAPKEFFEAGEYRQPGSLRLIQQIEQRVAERSNIGAIREVRPVAVSTAPAPGAPQVNLHASGDWRASGRRKGGSLEERSLGEPSQAGRLADRRQSNRAVPGGNERRTRIPFEDRRRADRRQSIEGAPNGVERRADRAHYNKDMGDLSDPYTVVPGSRRPDHSGISAVSTLSRLVRDRSGESG